MKRLHSEKTFPGALLVLPIIEEKKLTVD